jgi:hypothetical protein
MSKFWRLVHHTVAHPWLGVTLGHVGSIRFHAWTATKAWPSEYGQD